MKQQVVPLSRTSAQDDGWTYIGDATATMCSVNRSWPGKKKHVDMQNLWIQEVKRVRHEDGEYERETPPTWWRNHYRGQISRGICKSWALNSWCNIWSVNGLHGTKLGSSQQRADWSLTVVPLLLATAPQATRTIGLCEIRCRNVWTVVRIRIRDVPEGSVDMWHIDGHCEPLVRLLGSFQAHCGDPTYLVLSELRLSYVTILVGASERIVRVSFITFAPALSRSLKLLISLCVIWVCWVVWTVGCRCLCLCLCLCWQWHKTTHRTHLAAHTYNTQNTHTTNTTHNTHHTHNTHNTHNTQHTPHTPHTQTPSTHTHQQQMPTHNCQNYYQIQKNCTPRIGNLFGPHGVSAASLVMRWGRWFCSTTARWWRPSTWTRHRGHELDGVEKSHSETKFRLFLCSSGWSQP